jgi:hypothetical protein
MTTHRHVSRPYRLTVAGPLPSSVAAIIGERFAGVHMRTAAAATVLDVRCADQPALRALLTLIWDAGHDVLSLNPTVEQP